MAKRGRPKGVPAPEHTKWHEFRIPTMPWHGLSDDFSIAAYNLCEQIESVCKELGRKCIVSFRMKEAWPYAKKEGSIDRWLELHLKMTYSTYCAFVVLHENHQHEGAICAMMPSPAMYGSDLDLTDERINYILFNIPRITHNVSYSLDNHICGNILQNDMDKFMEIVRQYVEHDKKITDSKKVKK